MHAHTHCCCCCDNISFIHEYVNRNVYDKNFDHPHPHLVYLHVVCVSLYVCSTTHFIRYRATSSSFSMYFFSISLFSSLSFSLSLDRSGHVCALLQPNSGGFGFENLFYILFALNDNSCMHDHYDTVCFLCNKIPQKCQHQN